MSERWKPHVTVAAVIERMGMDGARRFLLVEEQTADGLKLNNPAGHLELGESPEQGVVREVLEETACTFTPECVVGVYFSRFQRLQPDPVQDGAATRITEDTTYLRLAYAGQVGEADPARVLDTGIVRTLWMTLDELRESRARHRSALVLACVQDYLSGKRHPLSLVSADATLQAPEIRNGTAPH